MARKKEPDSPSAAPQTSGAADHLGTYRAKRSVDTTPEPMGSAVSPVPGHLFVVHKHAARQLHFDLRLEMEGVLRSWAVPRGPSYDMADKRLAVKVEDHPLEYGDFEGIIPAGNYGAGGVIVWDRGEWVPLEPWKEGLEKGKLLFELKGYKLHGKWALVKIKKSERDWLLLKERDAYVKSPGDQFNEESVLSGLTVDQVKAGETAAPKIRESAEAAGAIRARVKPTDVKPMLAELAEEAFTRDGWLFELKLDGYRIIACKQNGEPLLLTRKGLDYTETFPEVARAVKALPVDSCILDGEVVVLDAEGKPSFSGLQQRGLLRNSIDIRRAAVELPATLFVFDLLAVEDFDLRDLPLTARKDLLREVAPSLGAVRLLDHIEREGEAFLQSVSALGLEGIIAKDAAAPYRAGRSNKWIKIKAERTEDFVIVGFTQAKGSRSGFGALHLADYVKGELVYAGRVGTGFDAALLDQLSEMLLPIVRDAPPCLGPLSSRRMPGSMGDTLIDGEPTPKEAIPDTKTTTWVAPENVCEVRFREWTPDGVLRHAVFLRNRPDKPPSDCIRKGWDDPDTSFKPSADAPADVSPTEPAAAPEKTINFSNLKKVYWPADKYTKGDLIEFYRAAWPWMAPYLRDRPVVLTRFPDGIDGKSFYQKDAPEFAPDWIRRVNIWSEDTQREIRFFVLDDVEALLYVANMGSIPIHLFASRASSLELPDWCVMDLDPKDAPFSDVIRLAIAMHELCDRVGLPNYVKTTGKTGLHILLPLGRQFTYAQSRTLGELLARVVLQELGDIATITRHVSKRGDKVYLDYLQNRHGQTIVGPFSVRPLPGATVSMPLTWDEVNDSLDPRNYTIKNAIERLERIGDPVVRVLGQIPDLVSVLDKIGQEMQSEA